MNMRYGKIIWPSKSCKGCDKMFYPLSLEHIFCTVKCRTEFRSRERLAVLNRARLDPRECKACKKIYTPSEKHQQYCCEKCNYSARYRRKQEKLKSGKSEIKGD